MGTTDLTFAGGWKEYRSAAYSGSTDDLRPGGIAPINEVTNAVAIYPNATAARGALNQLHATLDQCASLHHTAYDFTLNKPDSATLKLDSEGWIHLYTVNLRCWYPSACWESNPPSRSPTPFCRR
ncbi:MAG: sensor domain-containing protein [Mycobacterium sp.]